MMTATTNPSAQSAASAASATNGSSPSSGASATPSPPASTPPIRPPPPPIHSHFFHRNPDHSSVSFAAINRMRLNSQLCDIVLKIGGEEIRAHRVVLASVSPYFYAMFNDDMAEKLQCEVTLHDIDSSALHLLVDYAYSGEILITEDNVQVLLPASSLLQMASVTDACCKFLLRQLHPSNCLGIRSFADAHACKDLHRKSHRFALQNFQEVMQTEEFLLLPIHEVEGLISSAQLNVPSEEMVFLAVLSWVKHDLAKREQHLPQLMRHVRLALIGRSFLMSRVEGEALVRRGGAEVRELVLEAMKYHLLPEQRAALSTPRTAHRRPQGTRPYLFAIGGGNLFATHNECERYSPRTDRWHSIAPMIFRRSRTGVTAIGHLLYVVGGYDGATDLATAECYNPLTNQWAAVTPMGTKRSCLGICSFDGLAYVCGGYDGASCLSSVERFDPLTSVWTSCPAMVTRRRYCRLAVLEKCIYAVGGFDSSNYQASVERLDPREGRWVTLPAMSSRRSSSGVAAMPGDEGVGGAAVYCVGGNDGTMCMSSGERLNVRRNAWEPIAPMISRRATHELVNVSGRLFAVGGNDGSSSLSSVERYEPRSNKWCAAAPMLARRNSVAAAALDCLFARMGDECSMSLAKANGRCITGTS
ncbi:kelch-like protein 17 [Hetaerina americana]|uniref:kelch-like protein 17 n=1 Tax=Hetaerina americana TaxID=62018 RepID=UPI003A7F2D00